MRCSVVFGVTSRVLVINISSFSPAINTAACYQRCVITCKTLAVVHRRPRLQHLTVAALTQAVKPDIGSESRFLPTPPAFDAPVRRVPVGILLCHGKTRMAWLPDGEKMLMIRLFVLAWSTNVTDTRTDRRIDTTWWHRPRLHSIARQTAKIIWILLVLVLHWAVDVIEVTLNVVTVFLSNLLVWCPKFYSCSSSLHYVYYPWQYPYFISVFEPSTSCWWHTNFLLLSEWSWLKHYSPDWCQTQCSFRDITLWKINMC